ncbi:MAG: segregation/condensation protein A [Oscillospiraceae bacterium]|jgi:segregation and condensation protein A|nr:segregation/condensation protein A [Oscillospiraceae bacterium]
MTQPSIKYVPVNVHLSQFDGPLDLLLHLIDEARIDIRDIFVSQITEQYLAVIELADDLDMDAASAFLAMAATLLEIKSRALLPRPPQPEPDEDEARQALIRQLETYRALKLQADSLRIREDETGGAFFKLPEECPGSDQDVVWTNLTINALTDAWLRLLRRASEREDTAERMDAPRRVLPRDAVTIEAFMERIERRLRLGACAFENLFGVKPSRTLLVTGFLALLELMRQGRVTARQAGAFGAIIIEPNNDAE